jgi:hypothetical protein
MNTISISELRVYWVVMGLNFISLAHSFITHTHTNDIHVFSTGIIMLFFRALTF